MSQYVITIVPVTDEGSSGPAAQTMVRIDIDGAQPTVKELTMRAPEGSGLAAAPYVDFEMLVAAFIPPASARAGGRRPAPAPRVAPAPARTTTARRANVRRGAGSAAAKRASADHLRVGRAYRKAPELAELEDVYLRTGTITGVAEHFGVPVHTAQGWITRMRRKNTPLAGR